MRHPKGPTPAALPTVFSESRSAFSDPRSEETIISLVTELCLAKPQIAEDGEDYNHDTDDVEDIPHGFFLSAFE